MLNHTCECIAYYFPYNDEDDDQTDSCRIRDTARINFIVNDTDF